VIRTICKADVPGVHDTIKMRAQYMLIPLVLVLAANLQRFVAGVPSPMYSGSGLHIEVYTYGQLEILKGRICAAWYVLFYLLWYLLLRTLYSLPIISRSKLVDSSCFTCLTC
jgi:hypothetical protein